MDRRVQQVLNRRYPLPLTTGVTDWVELQLNDGDYHLACYEKQHDSTPRFLPRLKDSHLVNNTTEKGPCLFLICPNGEFEFQADSKELFSAWLEIFVGCGVSELTFDQLYRLNDFLGEGSFAKVYVGQHLFTKEKVCIKAVDKKKVKDSNVYTEIEILRKISHQYVIRLYAAYEKEETICLVLEYLRGGELFDWLSEHGPYTESTAKQAMRRILLALQSMHQKGVVHRDLKTENLILEQQDNPVSLKIIDFGLASTIGASTMGMRCGSPGYVAPEILEDRPYGTKVDVFSAGVILYTMLGGYPPFRGSNVREILRKNLQCQIAFNHARWSPVSQRAKDIVLWMTNRDPDIRCSAVQALTHPWFEKIMPPPTDLTKPAFGPVKQLPKGTHAIVPISNLSQPSTRSTNATLGTGSSPSTASSIRPEGPGHAVAPSRQVDRALVPSVKPSSPSGSRPASGTRSPVSPSGSYRSSPDASTKAPSPASRSSTPTDTSRTPTPSNDARRSLLTKPGSMTRPDQPSPSPQPPQPALTLPVGAVSPKPSSLAGDGQRKENSGTRPAATSGPTPRSPLSTPHYVRTKRRSKTGTARKETSQLVQSNAYSSKAEGEQQSKRPEQMSPKRKLSATSLASAVSATAPVQCSMSFPGLLERLVGLPKDYEEDMEEQGFIGAEGVRRKALESLLTNRRETTIFDKQIEELTASAPYLPSVEHLSRVASVRRGIMQWRMRDCDAPSDEQWSPTAKGNRMLVTSVYFRACRFGQSRVSVTSSRMSLASKKSFGSVASSRGGSPTRPFRQRGASLWVHNTQLMDDLNTTAPARKGSKTVRFAGQSSNNVTRAPSPPQSDSLRTQRRRVQSLPGSSGKSKMAAEQASETLIGDSTPEQAAGPCNATAASPMKRRPEFNFTPTPGSIKDTIKPPKNKVSGTAPTESSPVDNASSCPSSFPYTFLQKVTGVARLRPKSPKAADKVDPAAAPKKRASLFKR